LNSIRKPLWNEGATFKNPFPKSKLAIAIPPSKPFLKRSQKPMKSSDDD
jgi:hypothetical protein